MQKLENHKMKLCESL